MVQYLIGYSINGEEYEGGGFYYDGKGTMYFPSGASIDFSFSQLSIDYHLDTWPINDVDAKKTLMSELNLRGRNAFGSEPPIHIIVRLEYNGIELYTYAVVRPRPHDELDVWLIGSSVANGDQKGMFDKEVREAPGVFKAAQSKSVKVGSSSGGSSSNNAICMY